MVLTIVIVISSSNETRVVVPAFPGNVTFHMELYRCKVTLKSFKLALVSKRRQFT